MAVANADFRSLDWLWPNFLYYGAVLYRAKWFILGVTFIFALTGVSTAVITTNKYQATVVVAPAKRNNRVGINSIRRAANLFSGLNIGLRSALDNGAGSNLQEALATLRSRDFLKRFVERRQLGPKLREPSSSDPDASGPDEIREIPLLQYAFQTLDRTYEQFGKRLSGKMEKLMRKLYRPHDFDRDVRKRDIPDSDNGRGIHEKFRGIIAIERRPRQGLINVKVRWKHPVVAAEWANAVIADLNSFLRETAIAQARKRIAYLNRELDKTSVIPLRQSIYRLIEAETHTIMIAETRSDYAFKVIDSAVPPSIDDPIRPKRLRLITTATLMGFAIAVFAAILLDYVRSIRRWQGEGNPAAR